MRMMSILFCAILAGSMSACGEDEGTNGTSGNGSGNGSGGNGSGGMSSADIVENLCDATCSFVERCLPVPVEGCRSECAGEPDVSVEDASAACASAINDYANCLANVDCATPTGCTAEIQAATTACSM